MREFSVTVDIQAPPDRVWAVMHDVQRWPEWTPSVTSVERIGSGPFAVGSRARVRQPKLAPAVWTVTEIDPGAHSFTWVTRGPGIRVTARHRVEASGQGSRATLSVAFSGLFGWLVARITRRLNDEYLALEAAGLKKTSEARTQGARG